MRINFTKICSRIKKIHIVIKKPRIMFSYIQRKLPSYAVNPLYSLSTCLIFLFFHSAFVRICNNKNCRTVVEGTIYFDKNKFITVSPQVLKQSFFISWFSISALILWSFEADHSYTMVMSIPIQMASLLEETGLFGYIMDNPILGAIARGLLFQMLFYMLHLYIT